MLESLVNPKKMERRPWEMFFIGLVYASLSVLLVNWVFGQDPVLSKYSGILVVTFSVMFSIPFIYYTLKLEEKKDENESSRGFMFLLEEHVKAIKVFMWLFLGFVVAFSFWYVVLESSNNFHVQIETYCMINRPGNFESCVKQYESGKAGATGFTTNKERFFTIFTNNIYVLIFTLIFSLIFGAGAIFILAWNASVIAAAVGIFARSEIKMIPLGIARYMLHGLPEIAAYFIAALAGGILGIAIIRREFKRERFWAILQDSLNLIVVAVFVLFIAATLEIFVTPALF